MMAIRQGVFLLCLMEFWQWWKLGGNNGIQ
jgi:hypothetical protein